MRRCYKLRLQTRMVLYEVVSYSSVVHCDTASRTVSEAIIADRRPLLDRSWRSSNQLVSRVSQFEFFC